MRRLVLVALIVLPLLIIVTLPAALVIPRFDPPPAMGQFGGTLWSGHARWRQAGQVPMTLEWRWAWGSHWNWTAFDSESRIQGHWRPGQNLTLEQVSGRLSVERLDLSAWLPLSPPQGFVSLALDSVMIAEGQVPEVRGIAVWEEAGLAGVVQESLGRIEVRFEVEDGAAVSAQGQSPDPHAARQIARIRSLAMAPVSVTGTIELGVNSYQADLWLRASSDRPELAAQLGALGVRQPDGQIRIQLSGDMGLTQTGSAIESFWAALMIDQVGKSIASDFHTSKSSRVAHSYVD